MDIFLQEPIHSNDLVVGCSKPKHMEEEPESIDIGDLDIFSLEQAFKRKEFDKIPDRQLKSLEVILSRGNQQRTLGFQPGSQWDGKNLPKDTKK